MTDKKPDPIMEKIEALEASLAQALEENQTTKDAQARALADLHNYQRRETQAKAHWSRDAVVGFLQKILPSLLELNLGSTNTSDHAVKAVIDKFFGNLDTQGLQKIEPLPETPINTEQHDVLMAAEGKPGTVVTCLEPGWIYLDKVIIPAKVSGAQQ